MEALEERWRRLRRSETPRRLRASCGRGTGAVTGRDGVPGVFAKAAEIRADLVDYVGLYADAILTYPKQPGIE